MLPSVKPVRRPSLHRHARISVAALVLALFALPTRAHPAVPVFTIEPAAFPGLYG
jgi:hypothetical protein